MDSLITHCITKKGLDSVLLLLPHKCFYYRCATMPGCEIDLEYILEDHIKVISHNFTKTFENLRTESLYFHKPSL